MRSLTRHPVALLSEYIAGVSLRNTESAYLPLVRVSSGGLEHVQRPRDTPGILLTYKIVREGQFVYNPGTISKGWVDYLRHPPVGLVSPSHTVFDVGPGLTAEYLLAFLRSAWARRQMEMFQGGSVVPRITWKDFRQIRIPVPPLPEQKAAGDILAWIRAAGAQRAERFSTLAGYPQGSWNAPKDIPLPARKKVEAAIKALMPLFEETQGRLHDLYTAVASKVITGAVGFSGTALAGKRYAVLSGALTRLLRKLSSLQLFQYHLATNQLRIGDIENGILRGMAPTIFGHADLRDFLSGIDAINTNLHSIKSIIPEDYVHVPTLREAALEAKTVVREISASGKPPLDGEDFAEAREAFSTFMKSVAPSMRESPQAAFMKSVAPSMRESPLAALKKSAASSRLEGPPDFSTWLAWEGLSGENGIDGETIQRVLRESPGGLSFTELLGAGPEGYVFSEREYGDIKRILFQLLEEKRISQGFDDEKGTIVLRGKR